MTLATSDSDTGDSDTGDSVLVTWLLVVQILVTRIMVTLIQVTWLLVTWILVTCLLVTRMLKELKKLLALWGQRDLSVLGRIQVFKSLAFAKIIYQCNNLAVPAEFLKELNQIAFNFIWGYKPEKVKRNTIISGYEDGGLKMLDVESFVSAQKVMWVKRLLMNKEGSWKILPNLILSEILGNHSFQCSTAKGEQMKSIPLFYRQLFIAWNKTKENPGEDPFKIRREVLWHNNQIKIRGRDICYRNWYDKGIVMLHDIVQENGDFKSKVDLERQFNVTIGIMEYNGLLNQPSHKHGKEV